MAKKKKKPFKGYNKKKHARTGGLNDKERARINRKEGSNLKRPVTGKVKAGSKAANRRKSFCARMSGVKGPTSKDGQLTPKGAALKRWECRKSLQKSDMPPKAKLAAFLRDHIDNKLALKAAEPTITKSDEKTGMSALMKALKECACKKSDKLSGGKGDTKDISDFDPKQVEMGLKVEMEHTKDREVAQEIVADHLSEDPSYYSKLKGSGLADELKKAGRCWEGYEPTPGKKPYSKGSCRKIKKSISAEAIEAGQYQGEQLDSHHHNRLGVEYKGMAQKAHKIGDKKKAREYHDKALHHFKMADKMGFQQEEPLEKKISGKVAAAGLGLASALTGLAGVSGKTSETADKQPQVEMTAKPIPKEKYPDLGAHDAISMIESSGGKNIIHKFIPKQNQRAVSRYGLLPTRVMELYARSSKFRESPQGKMVGEILEPHLSKHKTKNFYDTAAFVQKTPKDVRGQLYQQINKITENPEHDKAIFEASRKHSMENLSGVTSDPVELEIMATHAHHWHWPRTKRLYQKGGLDAVINDDKSKEGNYIKKFHKQLPEGHPVKERIEEALPETPQPEAPVKKVPIHGS
jgi:hypothetical protein